MNQSNNLQGITLDEYKKFTNAAISSLVRNTIFEMFKYTYELLGDISTLDIQHRFQIASADRYRRNLPTYIRIRLLKEDRLLLYHQVMNYISRK